MTAQMSVKARQHDHVSSTTTSIDSVLMSQDITPDLRVVGENAVKFTKHETEMK